MEEKIKETLPQKHTSVEESQLDGCCNEDENVASAKSATLDIKKRIRKRNRRPRRGQRMITESKEQLGVSEPMVIVDAPPATQQHYPVNTTNEEAQREHLASAYSAAGSIQAAPTDCRGEGGKKRNGRRHHRGRRSKNRGSSGPVLSVHTPPGAQSTPQANASNEETWQQYPVSAADKTNLRAPLTLQSNATNEAQRSQPAPVGDTAGPTQAAPPAYRNATTQTTLKSYDGISDSRERSRSPVAWRGQYHKEVSNTELYLANLPLDWDAKQIIKFVKDVTKSIIISTSLTHVDLYEDDFGGSRGSCVLNFNNPHSCRMALEQLRGIVCEGKDLYVTLNTDPPDVSDSADQPENDYPPDERFENNVSKSELSMLRFPKSWNEANIVKYIKETTNSIFIGKSILNVRLSRDKNGTSKGFCVVEFNSPNSCAMALEKLKGATCEGKLLSVRYFSHNKAVLSHGQPSAGPQKMQNIHPRRGEKSSKVPRHEHMSMETPDGEHELYGLSMNYLKSLNIKPPLSSLLFVGNISSDVDEAKLRDVFSLAGHVVRVEKRKSKESSVRSIATIEYDHPVEAVQAISMFHNQLLFGQPLVVVPHKAPHKKFLPPGLQAIGPGLGPNGDPLKGVRYAIQVEPMKQFFMKQIEKLTNELEKKNTSNRNSEGSTNTMAETNMNQMSQYVTPINAFQPVYGYNAIMNPQVQPMVTGVVQPMMGNEMAMQMQQAAPNQTLAQMAIQSQAIPTSGQNMAAMTNSNVGYGGMVMPGQAVSSSGQNLVSGVSNWNTTSTINAMPTQTVDRRDQNRHPRDYNDKGRDNKDDRKRQNKPESDMLMLTNLPRSVTENVLRNKMREVGELKMVELTGRGRALVRFVNISDAERCRNIFHHSKVDGQIIEVNYF